VFQLTSLPIKTRLYSIVCFDVLTAKNKLLLLASDIMVMIIIIKSAKRKAVTFLSLAVCLFVSLQD